MASTELSCIFCKESFEDREQLQIHFRKHGDPKFNQNVKSNKSVSGNDYNLNTEVSNDAAEMVSCDVCADVFPTISKAITHKHKMHPDHDAKYFCPWCGKLFTMKHLYNKHIEKNHMSEENTGSGFHCHYCDVDFFAAAAMIYHNKFFHRQDTELASIGYSKKMKHFDQEVLPIYYCPFCGEEYINKVNLHKHMGDDHIEENQSPDDVLRCPLCEAIFYHLDAYELHLTFHSDADLYSEQNDIVKSITEFSLEAVPPLMEKVENEVQEDAEVNMSSMGIENFLQQAMNESNDNSNSDIPHKKKKHKKHKKSKKATITLDEFLSMNTDVFGEGIDLQVQGIEEVPSQVVAKQLRKPMNMKKRPTAMQSKEIEKLRKQGIVIKKNTGSGKPNSVAMKVNSVSNVTQKLPSMPQSKSNLSSTDDVINKLMSQRNSQIKIVKKPVNSNSESDTGTGPPNIIDTKNDSQETMETEDQAPEDNHEMTELRLDREHKSPIQEEMEVGEVDLSKPIPLKWKDDPPFGNGTINNHDKNTGRKSAMDVLKSISQHITIKPMTKTGTGQIKTVIDEKSNSELLTETSDKQEISHENKNNNKNLDALKRLGLTVKSVNQAQNQSPGSPKTIPMPLKSSSPAVKANLDDKSVTERSPAFKDAGEKRDNQCPESPNILALRNISKHITVKSPTSKASQIVHSTDMSDSEDKEVPVDSHNEQTNNKHVKRIQGNSAHEKKARINSPEVLKNISKHITVKTPNKSPVENAEMQSEDENIDNFEEETNKPRKNIEAKSPNVIKSQLESKSLDALKNLSKHITIKAPNKTPIVDEMHSGDENMDNFEELESEIDKPRSLLHSSKQNIQSKSPKVVHNQSQSKSLDALKNLSKHITIKAPNKPQVTEEIHSEDENMDNFEEHENESDDVQKNLQIPQMSKKAMQSPNNSSKTSLDALKNLSKHITIKAPNQPISEEDTGSNHEDFDQDQDGIKTLNNKNIGIPKNEKLKEVSRTDETSQKSKSLDVLKNLSKNITIKSPNKKIDNDYEGESDINASKNLMKGNPNLMGPDKLSTPAHNFKSPEIRKVSLNSPLPNKNQSMDIMKKFPNITAKSLSATNTTKCVKQQVTSSQSMSIIKGKTFQKCVKTEQTSEEIETYNIDDSEDEETHTPEEHFEPPEENPKLFNKSADTVNAIKKLNSNITIKPRKNLPEINSPTPEDNIHDDEEIGGGLDVPDDSSSLTQQVNVKLQETLKNLSRNICVKPTSSPKTIPKSPTLNHHVAKKNLKKLSNNQASSPQTNIQSTLKNIGKHVSVKSSNTSKNTETNETNYHSNEEDSDLDQNTNVKITEMDDCSSDDEAISKMKSRLKNTDSNVIVQTPSDDENEDIDNIEDQIQPTIISKKPVQESPAGSEHQLVKYVTQNPRLKSMQDFSFDDDDEHDAEDENPEYNQKVLNKVATNQSKAKSSQIINKAVRTVQTFQSQTVIEEITTTVTKTIRTVNQAVMQETRGQNPGVPQIRPSFQGTANLPQTNNFRGIQVRPARPTMGAQVRHSGPRTRPGMIRPNVPMRPNVPRATHPRMPAVRQNLRAPNAQKAETRPMKIAPNAIVASKRPSLEPPGHFSCFKKPKESLIPVPDIPPIMTKTNNASQQVKMSAQMTKSNFSTNTKVIKGHSVMTSAQNKSEMSCSTEQILGNMSGLKIVKTSQKQAQAMQVEERSEVSAPKRSNAMEAIERLQSMGLLVKKPRVDDTSGVQDDDNVSDDDYLEDDEQ